MNSWLAQFDRCLRAAAPGLPPAAERADRLERLPKDLGKPIPPAFQDFLQWIPGESLWHFQWDLEHCRGGQLLEAEEIADLMNEWRGPAPRGTVNWWNPNWVPFLDTGKEQYLCIDLEGSLGNPAGSLLLFQEKEPLRPILFPSFEGWLRWLATSVEQGAATVKVQEKLVQVQLGARAGKTYKELFSGYPKAAAAEILGLSLLDQVLYCWRKLGLKLGPNATFPSPLTAADLEQGLRSAFVRPDGTDGDCLRVSLLCSSASQGGNWTVYLCVRPTDQGLWVENLVALPENVADVIRSGLILKEQGDLAGAARRLNQAAYLCFQGGFGEEALAVLQRVLLWEPGNSVAQQSKKTLEEKKVAVNGQRLRPLLRHLAR